MYKISGTREGKCMYIWVSDFDLDRWCISTTPYIFESLKDAQIVLDQLLSIENTNLQNFSIQKI